MGLPDAGHPAVGDVADDAVAIGQRDARCARPEAPVHRTQPVPAAMLPAAMARVCHSCGKRPAFGQSRSHSMVATKRRFDPNLQKVRIREATAPRRACTCARAASRPARSPRPSAPAPAPSAVADPSLDPLPRRRRGRAGGARGPARGGQRPQRLPGRRRRHRRQHGADAARRARRARPPVRAGRASTRSAATRSSTPWPAPRCSAPAATRGVILSQLIRGAAEELISRPGELVDPVLIAAAMARAADRAYGSVREPAEGTILTVVREMAAPRRDGDRPHGRRRGCSSAVDEEQQNAMIAAVLEAALDAGRGQSSSAAPTCCRCCARPASSTPAATA